jgi:hypothetical protein
MSLATPRRGRGEHGAWPLSAATRRRLLAALLRRAESGDAAAAETLIRLSMDAERGTVVATTGAASDQAGAVP